MSSGCGPIPALYYLRETTRTTSTRSLKALSTTSRTRIRPIGSKQTFQHATYTSTSFLGSCSLVLQQLNITLAVHMAEKVLEILLLGTSTSGMYGTAPKSGTKTLTSSAGASSPSLAWRRSLTQPPLSIFCAVKKTSGTAARKPWTFTTRQPVRTDVWRYIWQRTFATAPTTL